MPVKLKLSQESQSGSGQEYPFYKDCITIGRENTCDLHLPDPHTRLVSRHHAQIERKGEGYQLLDLGSRNATFLNDEKLEAHRPYPLKNGDFIKIGEYRLQCFILLTEPAAAPPATLNPFLPEVQELNTALMHIGKKFLTTEESQRHEWLRQALATPLRELADSDLGEVFKQALQFSPEQNNGALATQLAETAEKLRQAQAALESLQASHQALRAENDHLNALQKTVSASPPAAIPVISAEPMNARAQRVFEMLLELSVDFIKQPPFFRGEVFKETVSQSSFFSSVEAIKKRLLSPEISDEDFAKRLADFQMILRADITHQVAVFNGYRVAVREGTRRLLVNLDAEAIKKEFATKTLHLGPLRIPWQLFPLIFEWKLLQAYRHESRRLLQEDQSYLEEKIFGAAFKKGYDERMEAGESKR